MIRPEPGWIQRQNTTGLIARIILGAAIGFAIGFVIGFEVLS